MIFVFNARRFQKNFILIKVYQSFIITIISLKKKFSWKINIIGPDFFNNKYLWVLLIFLYLQWNFIFFNYLYCLYKTFITIFFGLFWSSYKNCFGLDFILFNYSVFFIFFFLFYLYLNKFYQFFVRFILFSYFYYT